MRKFDEDAMEKEKYIIYWKFELNEGIALKRIYNVFAGDEAKKLEKEN